MREYLAVLIGTLVAMTAYGLLNPSLTLYMDAEGFGARSLGFAVAIWSLPIALFRPVYRKLIFRLGEIGAALMGLLGAGTMMLMFLCSPGLIFLIIIQALHGAAFGLFWTSSHMIAVKSVPKKWAGRLIAGYNLAPSLGAVGGSLLGQCVENPGSGLVISAFIMLLAAAICWLVVGRVYLRAPKTEEFTERRKFEFDPIYLLAFLAGIFEAAPWGLIVLFGKYLGLSSSDAMFLLTIFFIGQIAMSWPIGQLADVIGSMPSVMVIALGCIVLGFFISVGSVNSVAWLVALGVWGGLLNGFNGLALTALSEASQTRSIVAASASFVFYSNIGEFLGPIIGGEIMSRFGPSGFVALISASVVLCGGLAALARRVPV